jgi:TolB-like protein
VVHVITVYASASFVLIELVNNLTEPLNLPPVLATIVIIVLATGFPLAVILSWIYDLSGEGLERTKPLEETKDEQKASVPNVWKIATLISFLVILVLLTFNIVGSTYKLHPGDSQSLVILPCEKYTGDDQFDYVAAGLHSSLIGDMSKLGALRVTGKTSSSIYQNSDKSASDIAKELKVEALVEPAVMCYGDSICLQIRVITVYPEETQLFVEEYKVDKSQVLNLYNQITKQIAREMMVELSPEEERLLAKSRTVNREALDEYLKARAYENDFSRESIYKSLEYLNNALEKEPEWAPLYVGLATVWLYIQQIGFELPSIATPKIYEYLDKAMELDPDLSDSHYLSGLIAHVMEWDWEKSEKEFLKALAINPSDALSRIFYAQLLCVLQRNDEASAQGKLAMDLDPLNPMMKLWYGSLLLGIDDCETSLYYGEELVAMDPQSYFGNNIIEGAAYRCNEHDKVIQAVRYDLPFPVEEDAFNEIERIYEEDGLAQAYEVIVELLENFASDNYISFMDMSLRYIIADQPEKAMDWIEKGYELHDPQMTYITTRMYHLDPLFTNPRFIKIVEKMNLPLPEQK